MNIEIIRKKEEDLFMGVYDDDEKPIVVMGLSTETGDFEFWACTEKKGEILYHDGAYPYYEKTFDYPEDLTRSEKINIIKNL